MPPKKSKPVEPREKTGKRKQAAPAEPGASPRPVKGLQAPEVPAQMAADLLPMAQELRRIEDALDVNDRESKRLKAEWDKLEERMLAELERMGTQSVKMPGLGVFFVARTPRPKVVDEEALFADLRKRGLGEMIRETVQPAKLGALVKELRGENKPDPKGVEVWEQVDLRVRKA